MTRLPEPRPVPAFNPRVDGEHSVCPTCDREWFFGGPICPEHNVPQLRGSNQPPPSGKSEEPGRTAPDICSVCNSPLQFMWYGNDPRGSAWCAGCGKYTYR